MRGSRFLRTQLGLADFRVRSYEAVDRHVVVVLLTWASVERRSEQERSAQIKTYGDIIRRHRDEHAVGWLTSALEMMRETGDMEGVVQHFLRLETADAVRIVAWLLSARLHASSLLGREVLFSPVISASLSSVPKWLSYHLSNRFFANVQW